MRVQVTPRLKLFPLLILSTLMFVMILPGFVLAEDVKVGFVDLQKAISGTKEWKRSFASFKSSFKKEKDIIAKKEERLQGKLEAFKKQSNVLDPELKKKKAEKLSKERVEFERYVQDKNADFGKKEKEMTSKILSQMVKVIDNLGKVKKYTMILEQKALLFHDKGNDLTDMAIKAYDKSHK